jgi:hypothetical protein
VIIDQPPEGIERVLLDAVMLKSNALTTSFTTGEVLPENVDPLASVACRGCIPTEREDVEIVAPALPFNSVVPSTVDPSKNVTAPAGIMPPNVEVPLAVRVTTCPLLAGFGDAISVNPEGIRSTTSLNIALLGLKFAEPRYFPVIECAPTPSVEIENVATPLESRDAVPIFVVPSIRETVPVGTGADFGPRTVAVNAAAWVTKAGFGEATRLVVVAAPTTIS